MITNCSNCNNCGVCSVGGIQICESGNYSGSFVSSCSGSDWKWGNDTCQRKRNSQSQSQPSGLVSVTLPIVNETRSGIPSNLSNCLTFTLTGLTASLSGDTTRFHLWFNTSSVGQLVQVAVIYDFDGSGTKVTEEIFSAQNLSVTNTWILYNQSSAIVQKNETVALRNGTIKILLWQVNSVQGGSITFTSDPSVGNLISTVSMPLQQNYPTATQSRPITSVTSNAQFPNWLIGVIIVVILLCIVMTGLVLWFIVSPKKQKSTLPPPPKPYEEKKDQEKDWDKTWFDIFFYFTKKIFFPPILK